MTITLRPLKVEDWLGKKFVRNVYANQEVFQADMLARVLIALDEQKSSERVRKFIDYQLADAKKHPVHQMNDFSFDAVTEQALAQCREACHPIAALSVMRIARMEQIMLWLIQYHMPTDIRDAAQKTVLDYANSDLTIVLCVGGAAAEGSEQRIFDMTAKEILEEHTECEWHFYEFLNAAYAAESNLLLPAQLLLAKGFSLKALERLYHDKLMESQFLGLAMQLGQEIAEHRHAHLMRQTQMAFIAMTGFTNTQIGMPQDEAQRILYEKML